MAADVRYRCCEHCDDCDPGRDDHPIQCPFSGCPGRMPIDPETEG